MNSFFKWRPFLLGFFYMLAGSLPVWADDTEIYFGSGTIGTRNNILFVIDTSGSMDSTDGDSTTRMTELKSAFKTLLTDLDNVNVGIMRFNNPGGPVLYPVSNINQPVSEPGGSTLTYMLQATGEDGVQQNTAGTVDLNSPTLSLGTTIISGSVPYSFTQRLIVGTDDASSHLTSTDKSDTDLGNAQLIRRPSSSGAERVIGMRFSNVTIPASTVPVPVTIDSANLLLTTATTNASAPVTINNIISAEKVSGGTFSTASASRPSTRAAAAGVLSTTVNWDITGTAPLNNTVVTSPDLTSIVKLIAADPSWASGKPMTFFLKRNPSSSSLGRSSYWSADSNDASTNAPVLSIKYHTGSGPSVTADVTAAMRFTGIAIPRGATITGARLEFTAANSTSDPASYVIAAEKVGNSPALAASNFNLTARTSRTATVAWNSASSPVLGAWDASVVYPTPDLTAIVQDVVSQATWCGGNAMTFFVTGTGTRSVSSRDEASNTAPRLVITYDPSTVPVDGTSCLQAAFARQIGSSADDAEEDNDTSAASLTRTTLSLASSGSKVRRIGMRFNNVTIPKNAQIQSAYLQFRASSNSTTALNLSINGQAVADAPTFTSVAYNIRDRAKTSATVNWTGLPNWTKDGTYQSPDVSSVVQELVNQNGWAAGNDMAFLISGSSTSAYRQVYSYNGNAGYAPKLIINYIDNGTTSLRTVRHVLMELVDALEPNGNTPLQDTFYEAVQYFRGQAVDYGKVRGNGYTYGRVSHPDSMVPGSYTSITPANCKNSSSSSCKTETINGSPVYKSPINYACQSNHIVLLTDGLPNSDHSKTKIRDLPGFPTAACSFAGAGECVPELANWVNKTADISVGGSGSANLAGRQSIVVDTISFYQDEDGNDFLSQTATNGGGLSLVATSNESLVTALERVSVGAISENASFVAAGAAVNAFDRTQNRDDMYFSVFKPQKTPRWPGNLKKYKIGFMDDPSTTETTKVQLIIDSLGNPAVDPLTGFFKDDSKSYWSTAADGPDVTKGGAGGLITDYQSRNLYTNVGASTVLSASVNALATTNTSFITKAAFGVPAYSDTEFANLVDWTRGKDVKNEDNNAATTTRFVMADPLHSRPVAITYKGTDESPDITIFVASNSGTLHAIDNDTGQELFAFIPQELLPLQSTLYENVESSEHPYGLDGSITTWVIDPDGDGLVLNSNGTVQTDNKVVLVVGMGRGGRNYYALDVTDRTQPKLMWSIKGGTTTGFEQLGQTWSQPEKALVKISGETTPRRVLLFGGGYDAAQDNTSVRATDSFGAAVYMVDLATGALIWRAGKGTEYDLNLADMKYGIPAQLSGADLTGDGLADVFFVGDVGGQVWRFDIKNGSTAANLVSGGVIADLGVAAGTNLAANNRRFYHAPSFFLGKNNGTPYLGVVIGSGYRGHPLSQDTTDMFFMIRQTSIFTAPTSYSKVVLSNLMDITSNVIGEGTDAEQTAARATLSSQQGWYLRLTNSGEKVLSTPLVQNGEVFFSTYEPSTSVQTNPCMPQTGTNRSYQMNVVDATPSRFIVGSPVAADRSTILLMGGIASDPISNPTKDSADGVWQNLQALTPKGGAWTQPKRIYWYENRAR